MDEKTARRYLRRKFSPLGWTLIGYYGLMNVMVLLTMLLDNTRLQLQALMSGRPFAADESVLMNNGWGYLAAIGVGLLVLFAWKGEDYLYDDLFHREQKMRPAAFFALLCLCVGSQFVNGLWVMVLEAVLNVFGLSAIGILEQVSGQSNSLSMFLYASLAAPIAEELLFRGLILRTLQPFGKKLAIFGSALLFGLFHGNLLQTPYAVIMGLVLGYVTVEYSIIWAIALHGFNNLVLADLLSRLVNLLPEVLGMALQSAILMGAGIAAIVLLAMNRQKISEYLRSEQTDRRALGCFFLNSGVLVLTTMMLINMVMMISPM